MRTSPQIAASPVTRSKLYPPIEPYRRFRLPVTGGHELYVEASGSPDAKPVVVLHGGPGAGCSPAMRRYFDPARYHVILFDQRGCGKSTPHASVENNTTWDLVADIEAIRAEMGLDRWQVFGGSWGSTLALLYAQAYPERVSELVLRGVFLMTQGELDWFYRGGAARFFPEEWARFLAPLTEREREDPIAGYAPHLFHRDPAHVLRYARPWSRWEGATATLHPAQGLGMINAEHARAFARIENHYFTNGGWLGPKDHILANMDRIAHLPGTIVQGRYDCICPPASACRLAEHWPMAELRIVPDAGHALSEPGITAELLRATDRYAE